MKPFEHRNDNDEVIIDGPGAFDDMERAAAELEAEFAAMTPAQREQAAREAQARLDEMRRHAA